MKYNRMPTSRRHLHVACLPGSYRVSRRSGFAGVRPPAIFDAIPTFSRRPDPSVFPALLVSSEEVEPHLRGTGMSRTRRLWLGPLRIEVSHGAHRTLRSCRFSRDRPSDYHPACYRTLAAIARRANLRAVDGISGMDRLAVLHDFLGGPNGRATATRDGTSRPDERSTRIGCPGPDLRTTGRG
jgi:hypothetical protein